MSEPKPRWLAPYVTPPLGTGGVTAARIAALLERSLASVADGFPRA